MEASTAIGFQTVLTVSELGLSHAHWPVSMVTSLMGVRGCVRKRSPIHSLAVGVENYMVLLSGCNDIRHYSDHCWLVLVYYFLGSFLSLFSSIITNKSESTTKWLTQERVDYIVNDPGH